MYALLAGLLTSMQEQQRCNTALAIADQCSFCLFLFLLYHSPSLCSDFITT